MIAVVGGRGVIGSAIVEALRARRSDVIVITHDREHANLPGVRYGDLLIPETLGPALVGAEVVIQSANFVSYPIEKPGRRHTFMDFDGFGTERLVAAAETHGVRRYIYISGVGVRADSPRAYYRAIWHGEQAVLNSRLEAVCIRPTLVYGPQDRGLNRVLRAARISPVIPVVGDGKQLHQPVYVQDVAEVVRRATDAGAPRGVFEVGGPDRMSLDKMLHMLFQLAGLRRKIVHIPSALARLGGIVFQNLPNPPLTVAAVDFLTENFVADLGPLQSAFNFKTTPFEKGLRASLGI